ncbi:MAG TPA: ABC transporter substrate-binding protein [Acidimicrobiales bacterium]|nr:ABC transporter substrate-binding protein [Acidimicrobiales bacterium]
MRGRPAAITAFGAGVGAVWLGLVSILGIITTSGGGQNLAASSGRPAVVLGRTAPSSAQEQPATTVTTPGGGGSAVASTASANSPSNTRGAPGGPAATVPGVHGTTPVTVGDTTGVTPTEIHIGIHAPETVGGAPLNLAADPIKGIKTYAQYINDHGGIYGRKLVLDIQDDGADAASARKAAATLINDDKNFVVSGTLGIDQIAIVAAEAYKRGVPYLAGGGNETKPIPGMFQLTASYQTMTSQLADYMRTDPNLKGKRVGILVSASEYIHPVADDFKRRLQADGFPVSTVVTAQGPTQNPDYNSYILQFRQTNTEVVVPLTDPVTTSQIVQRCAAGAACGWTYSFVDFAHDWDLALKLMAPTWESQHVRGLSTGCYYLAPEANDRAKCGALATARDQYIAINGQDAWNQQGSGAAFGYQIISMIKGALVASGKDLTRQKFVAALRAYQSYGDLVSGPITFAGSANTMHGATKMAVYEAQSNQTYKMVSPGLLDGF